MLPVKTLHMVDGKLPPSKVVQLYAKRNKANGVSDNGKTRRWFSIDAQGYLTVARNYPSRLTEVYPLKVFHEMRSGHVSDSRPRALGGVRTRPVMMAESPTYMEVDEKLPSVFDLYGKAVPYNGTPSVKSRGSTNSGTSYTYNPQSPTSTPANISHSTSVGASVGRLGTGSISVTSASGVSGVNTATLLHEVASKLTLRGAERKHEPMDFDEVKQIELQNRFSELSSWMDDVYCPTSTEMSAQLGPRKVKPLTAPAPYQAYQRPARLVVPRPNYGIPDVVDPMPVISEDHADNKIHLGKQTAEDIANAKPVADSKVVHGRINRYHNETDNFVYKTYQRIPQSAIEIYGQEMAVEVAFEDWKITNFAMIRDLVRRRAKTDKYFVRVADLMAIIDIIISEQCIIMASFEDWSHDESMLARLTKLSGNANGMLRVNGRGFITKLQSKVSHKLHQVMGDLWKEAPMELPASSVKSGF